MSKRSTDHRGEVLVLHLDLTLLLRIPDTRSGLGKNGGSGEESSSGSSGLDDVTAGDRLGLHGDAAQPHLQRKRMSARVSGKIHGLSHSLQCGR